MKSLFTILLLMLLTTAAFGQAVAPVRPESPYVIYAVSQVQPPWGCSSIDTMVRVGDRRIVSLVCHGANGTDPDSGIYIRVEFVKWAGRNSWYNGGK